MEDMAVTVKVFFTGRQRALINKFHSLDGLATKGQLKDFVYDAVGSHMIDVTDNVDEMPDDDD